MTDGAGGRSRRPSPVAPDGPARSAATYRDPHSRRTPLESAAAAEAWCSALPAKYLGIPLTQEPVTLLLEMADTIKALAANQPHGDWHVASSAYSHVSDPEFVVFLEFEGHWSQADPFTFDTQEEAEERIVELQRYKPSSFVFHVVKRTTTDEAVT